jgi:Fe-S-cluster-containing dehydrogenase component/formate-dependent nitrite reductase membrane component NrfD
MPDTAIAARPQNAPVPVRWAKVIDQTACIGCHACTTACKSENEVPLSVTRTYVKSVEVGRFPQARRAFQVTRCNQCADAPCVTACPTSAMHTRPDGIVDFAKSICIGCKACIAACPYDAIFINPADRAAEKCNFCAHRVDMGLEPACVIVCPVEAIVVGDLNDPASRVASIVGREHVAVRHPEKHTQPRLFYKGADESTLDPIHARRPPGGLFMWSEQRQGRRDVVSGHPGNSSSAAALLSYDVPHRAPWGWKVSLYTWTKSVAAGVYLVNAILMALGYLSWRNPLWAVATPLIALLFLGATGLLLIWDLTRPARFYLIFTRPQWHSWLVRGAVVLVAYGFALTIHLGAGASGAHAVGFWLSLAAVPLAILTAAYTAYLFKQARGRDLWQSPILPAHLVVQALAAGSAVFLPLAMYVENGLVGPLLWMLTAACGAHLILVAGETTAGHRTAHARLAVAEMTSGGLRVFFWTGLLLASIGAAAVWIGPVAALFVLTALLAYEHAYVQAGQSVPLA